MQISVDDNFHKQIPLDTDHSGLVKFPSRGDPEYDKVQSRIKELVGSAPDIVLKRYRLSDDTCGLQHISEVAGKNPQPRLPPGVPRISQELQGSKDSQEFMFD